MLMLGSEELYFSDYLAFFAKPSFSLGALRCKFDFVFEQDTFIGYCIKSLVIYTLDLIFFPRTIIYIGILYLQRGFSCH